MSESEIEKPQFPAEFVAHWASGPVNCCEKHREQILGLGAFLGVHVAVTKAEPDATCSNCEKAAQEGRDSG